MTHERTLDLLDVPGSVFVDSDASEYSDADDHDDEPEVEEVHDGGSPGARGKDVNHELKSLSPVIVQDGFQGQSLVGVQTHLVTDGLKAFVEVHEIGRLRDSGGVGFRKGLGIFNGGLTFNSGGFLDLVSLGRRFEDGLKEQPGWGQPREDAPDNWAEGSRASWNFGCRILGGRSGWSNQKSVWPRKEFRGRL